MDNGDNSAPTQPRTPPGASREMREEEANVTTLDLVGTLQSSTPAMRQLLLSRQATPEEEAESVERHMRRSS